MGRLFCALRAIIWANCALSKSCFHLASMIPNITCPVLSYFIVMSAVTTITQYAFDSNVWTRNIDSDPSPFPLSVVVSYAFPFMKRFIPQDIPTSPMTPQTNSHTYCLSGCTCSRKLSLPRLDPPPPLITRARFSYATSSSVSSDGSHQAGIPFRLPTDMDRRRSIVVSLDGLSV